MTIREFKIKFDKYLKHHNDDEDMFIALFPKNKPSQIIEIESICENGGLQINATPYE